MEEIILAKGKPTSIKKAVLLHLRSSHLFRSIMPLISTDASDILYMLERSILHNMTLPYPAIQRSTKSTSSVFSYRL